MEACTVDIYSFAGVFLLIGLVLWVIYTIGRID